MIDFKQEIADLLASVIDDLTAEDLYQMIEYPKHTEMGDFAFPCFRLAKVFRKAPNMIADDLVEKLGTSDNFEQIQAVSGYVNFMVNKSVFAKTVIEDVLSQKEQYGADILGNDKNIIVEYSSTNIAKPFHMGHIRSTMIGESLNRIYKFLGYNTTSINHLGDYGTQFGKLIVAFKLWGDRDAIEANPIPELLKIYVKFHEEAEAKPELDDEARAWFTKLENQDAEAQELWSWFREVSLKEFTRVYDILGVHFDSFAGESFYSDKMPAVLAEMREKNIMVKSEGAEIVDLEEHNMPPALITKKDGSTLYITRDLAAAFYRKKHYNFDKNIYVVGNQQKLHFQQWMKIIELMGYEWAKDCEHVDFGLVGLEEGTLSTRNGRVVFLEDVLKKAVDQTKKVIEEKNPNLENKDAVAKVVGVGAVVFQELSSNRIKDYTFSLEKTLSFEGETGPYVQYTHARACSILRKSNVDLSGPVDYSLLNDDITKAVISLVSKFNETVVLSHEKNEPSVVARYAVDVAQSFNRFYHDHPIITDDAELTKARVSLVAAVAQTIKNALKLVCLEAPERM